MILIKKFAGLFLIFSAGLLFIMIYGTLLTAVINYIKASTNEDFWYLITFITIRFGLKLIKTKAISEDSIEDIGS